MKILGINIPFTSVAVDNAAVAVDNAAGAVKNAIVAGDKKLVASGAAATGFIGTMYNGGAAFFPVIGAATAAYLGVKMAIESLPNLRDAAIAKSHRALVSKVLDANESTFRLSRHH